jgi:hypothetical protein
MKRLKYSIIFFYLALFALLALYDERLDPELARALAQPRPTVINPDNAWLAMLGFKAPAGTTPVSFAEKQLQEIEKAMKDAKSPADFFSVLPANKSELSFKGELPSFCSKENKNVVTYAVTHPAEVAVLSRDNSELLSRYEQLKLYSDFTEPLEYGYFTPFPLFSLTRNTQRLFLLRLALQAENGDLSGALAALRIDMNFWRLVAHDSETLISKLISMVLLSDDLKFAAELASSFSVASSELSLFKELLRPFDHGEASVEKAFLGETLYFCYGLEQSTWSRMQRWSPERLLLKHNSTINRMYGYNRDFIHQAMLSPPKYAEERQRQISQPAEMFKVGLPGLYNPSGELLAIIAIPQLSSYIERGHDMEGLRRLAMLKVLACAEDLPIEKMQEFLNVHAADLGDPYTGQPMQWDAENRRIYFPKLSAEGSVELYW